MNITTEMTSNEDIMSTYTTGTGPDNPEYLYFTTDMKILTYLLFVGILSLVPILMLCWFAIRFCLDERSWEQDIERYNQVSIIEFVKAARSVGQKVRHSNNKRYEVVNV